MKFEHVGFGKRLKTMFHVDFRRMFTQPLLYIMAGSCLVIPILILVMTTMMDGSVTVNPQTGVETVMEGFDSAWQIIAVSSADYNPLSMDMTTMCNINLLYFFAAVLVGCFVAVDFRSDYAKNLFIVRAKKADYVISKTLACFVGGALMILAFFIGTLLGGAISGLPFELGAAGVGGLVMCVLSKMLLMGAVVPLYLLWSVIAKQKLWLGLVGSLMSSMLLFMMIPMLTPLDSTIMNVIACGAGAALFSAGLGIASNTVLKKTSLV